MGSNFHYVIYPINQNKEYNFVSIINQNLSQDLLTDKKYFENNDFLQSLIRNINEKFFYRFKR